MSTGSVPRTKESVFVVEEGNRNRNHHITSKSKIFILSMAESTEGLNINIL